MKTENTEAMSEDEKAGIAWWNSLTHMARSYWLASAGTAVAAEAWQHFKQEKAEEATQQDGRQDQ